MEDPLTERHSYEISKMKAPPRSCHSSREGYSQALERRAQRRRRAEARFLKRHWATNIEINDTWFQDEDYDTDLESECKP